MFRADDDRPLAAAGSWIGSPGSSFPESADGFRRLCDEPASLAGSHPTARRFSGLAGAGPVGLSVPHGLIVGRPFRPFITRRVGVAAAREIKEIPAGRPSTGGSIFRPAGITPRSLRAARQRDDPVRQLCRTTRQGEPQAVDGSARRVKAAAPHTKAIFASSSRGNEKTRACPHFCPCYEKTAKFGLNFGRRDLAVRHIQRLAFGVPSHRIAVPAAARGLNDHPVAEIQSRDDFRRDHLLRAIRAQMIPSASPPSAPPARPRARLKCRSPRCVNVTLSTSILYSRIVPRPPRNSPEPPDPGAQRHAIEADRRFHLHRLGRQVHAVGGVGFDHLRPRR